MERHRISAASPLAVNLPGALRWFGWAACGLLSVTAGIPATVCAQPLALHTETGVPVTLSLDSTGLRNWNDYFLPAREETLVAEARLAKREARYRDAEQLLEQALQVNRASAGLHNPSQLYILDETLETLLLQRNWSEFDEKLAYLGWLNRRTNAANPEQLAAGLMRQSLWHRAVAATVADSTSAWYLIQGKYLNWQAISRIESAFGYRDRRLAPLLYQIALTHFYQTVSIERRGMASEEFTTDAKTISTGWAASRSETVRRSYRIGRESLQRIRAIYAAGEDASPITDALLQLHLADWEYLYGARDTAISGYQQVYRQLLDAGVPETEVEHYFSRLQPLPATSLITTWPDAMAGHDDSPLSFFAWSRTYPGAQLPVEFRQPPFDYQRQISERVQVSLTLDVNEEMPGGPGYDLTKLEVLEPSSVDADMVDRALAEIPLLVFRPRLVAGEPAALGPVLFDYRPAPLQ